MNYIIKMAWQHLKWNKWISILMIIEVTLGIGVLVYSLNLFSSLLNEEKERKQQRYDWCLEITSPDAVASIGNPALTFEDYETIQKITNNKTFCYIAVPEFYTDSINNYEFTMILADYDKIGLKREDSYWGSSIENIRTQFAVSGLTSKKLPKDINSQSWKTEVADIELKNCVIVPLEYMRQMEQEIEMAYIHMEWNSKEVSDTTFEKIKNYLTEIHGNTYSYRIYSPEIDLQNNGYKVKESIQLLMHLGGLFLLIFFVGILSVFRLLFDRREKTYGISLSCGVDYKKIFCEILLEIALMNGIGTFLGVVIGYIATYYMDIGLMIGYIKVQGSPMAFVISLCICCFITIVVSGMNYKRLKRKKIIELLNGY